MQDSSLCSKCNNSIWCDTWAEWKCKAKKRRIYNYKEVVKCDSYSKRPKDFKETRCQCDDCNENEMLYDD